jgi:hypothetical protein
MKNMQRGALVAPGLVLLVLLASLRSAQAGPAAPGHDPAARRTEARNLIVEALNRRMVREIDPAVVAADAERLAAALSESRLDTLLASRDAEALLDERAGLRSAARTEVAGIAGVTSSGVRSASAPVLGASDSDLIFVPVPPCRILDTRLVSAGPLAANETRSFLVAGTNAFLAQGGNGGGCGIPDGAVDPAAPAVVVNFIAVGPSGPGNLRAWEYGQPVPNASVINYDNVGALNIANGVVVPIEGTAAQPWDLNIRADVSGTHVVADVTGYFTRFPIEQFSQSAKVLLTVGTQASPTSLSDGTCHRITTCTVTLPAGVSGRVVIRSIAQVSIDHTNGTHDRVTIGAKLGAENPPNCTPINDQVANMDFEVPDIAPTESDVDVTITHGRDFAQSGTTPRTYSLLSNMIVGASTGDQIESARMFCMFIPDPPSS